MAAEHPPAARFCLLGPVQLVVGEKAVPLGGAGMRGVLAMLLLEPNQVVPLDRIVDVLWAHEPPASARTMVQGYVSRLRQRIAEAGRQRRLIVTTPPGYRLVVDESLIDVTVARSLLAKARGQPAARRAELLREANALWRGPALADLGGRLTAPELTELRLAILEALYDAQLELGRHREVIGELTQLIDAQPFRERLVAQLMLALYRANRRATALDVYQRFAHRAAEELGMDPGPQLRELHARVLRDDSTPARTVAGTGDHAEDRRAGARAAAEGAVRVRGPRRGAGLAAGLLPPRGDRRRSACSPGRPGSARPRSPCCGRTGSRSRVPGRAAVREHARLRPAARAGAGRGRAHPVPAGARRRRRRRAVRARRPGRAVPVDPRRPAGAGGARRRPRRRADPPAAAGRRRRRSCW